MPNITQKSCIIRGVEYLLSLSTSESSKERDIFVMDALNKVTQCCWRGIFDADTVTRLTAQAGSLKAFAAFTAMIKAAILRTAKTVYLDILTSDGLARKGGKSHSKQNLAVDPQRLYMILTYQTEFEECSYPLPLDLRKFTKLRSQEDNKRGDIPPTRSADEFDDQKIAFVEFQIEVKHLRRENQKLREALIAERSSRKEFEYHLNREKDSTQRDIELLLSTERSNFQKELKHTTWHTNLLTKNLTLAKREVDSLRIQVRRLQAENAVYKRSLTTRPSLTPIPTRSHASFPKHSQSSQGRSRLDLRETGTVRGSQKAKAMEKPRYNDRSVSPTHHQPPDHSTPARGYMNIQRYRSADALTRSHRIGPEPVQRSRSYSPALLAPVRRKPAFSIVKTLCPTESLLSVSRCSTPDPTEYARKFASAGFIRDSRYSRREPAYPVWTTSRAGSVDSRRSVRSSGQSPERSYRRLTQHPASRSVSPRNRGRSPLAVARQYACRPASPMRNSPVRFIRAGSGDRFRGRISERDEEGMVGDERNDKKGGFTLRSGSPADVVVQKYKERNHSPAGTAGLPDSKRRTSPNGAKFRDLLARLQGLGEDFSDSLANSPK